MSFEMMQTQQDQPHNTLGEVGIKIIGLANDLLKEIDTNWNEETISKVKENGHQLMQTATELKIVTKDDYDNANNFFLQIAQYIKTGSAYIQPYVETAHKPWKILCEIRSEFENPGTEAKKIVESKIIEYKKAERRRVQAEQDRLDRERREKEARDRAALEQKAREEREEAKIRLAKEAADKAAAEGRKAEAKAIELKVQRERAKLETEAQAREQRAQVHEAAAQSVYTPPTVAVANVARTEITPSGTSVERGGWMVEIVDEMSLIKAVAEDRLPLSVLNLDPERIKAALKRWAKVSLGKDVQYYEENGIVIESTGHLSARGNTKTKKA
jgi:hypothetical protein